MKKYLIIGLLLILQACASIPVDEDLSSEIVSIIESDSFKDSSYCSIYGGGVILKNSIGVCGITENSIVIHYGTSAKSVNDTRTIEIPLNEIEYVAFASRMRLKQIQIKTKASLIAISPTKDKAFVDSNKTKYWFTYLEEKGVETRGAEMYLEQKPTKYQIQYQQ